MAFLRRKKSPFPLKKTAFMNMTDAMTFEALDMVAKASAKGVGGLYVVMQNLSDRNLKLVHLDTLFSSEVGAVYSVEQCNLDMLNTVRLVRHASINPSLYGLDKRLKEFSGDLVLTAIVNPVNIAGVITKDTDAYGWQIAAFTGKHVNVDVFCIDGSPVSGSIEFLNDMWLGSGKKPQEGNSQAYFECLTVGPPHRYPMAPLVEEMLGHEVTSRVMKAIERAS